MLGRGRRQWKQAEGFFISHHIKPKGISSKMGEKCVFQVNKQKYALYTWAPPPSSMFHKLLLGLKLAGKIQYRLSEDVCCLVSLLVASFGQGCEPVGLTQTELSPMADTANSCFHWVSNTLKCLPPRWSQQLLGRVKWVQNFIMTLNLILS